MTLAVTLLLAGVLISAPAVHAQTGSDAPAQTFTGTLYSSAGGSAISGSPVSGNVYYTQSGTPVLYLDGWYYYPFTVQEDGAEVAGIDDEPTTNGWYSTASGQRVYYYNGWYYYPIIGTNTVAPGVPATGSTGSGTTVVGATGGTVTTPGVPNTGAGGNATAFMLVLFVSALAAAGGLSYATTRRAV
jgi:hypothetical protein